VVVRIIPETVTGEQVVALGAARRTNEGVISEQPSHFSLSATRRETAEYAERDGQHHNHRCDDLEGPASSEKNNLCHNILLDVLGWHSYYIIIAQTV